MSYELTIERVPLQRLEDAQSEKSNLLRKLASQTLSVGVHNLYTEYLAKINAWIVHVESNELIDR